MSAMIDPSSFSDPTAERAVLSSLLQFPKETLQLCSEETVSDEWFHQYSHQFRVLHGLAAGGLDLNFVTVRSALADAGCLDSFGGVGALSALLTDSCSSAFGQYLDILRKKFLARRLISLANEITQNIADDPANAGETLVRHVGNRLAELSSYGVRATTITHIKPMVIDAVNKLQTAHKNRGQTKGLQTGIHTLDRMTNGIQATHMFGIGGRPNHGKSAFMGHIVKYIGTNPDPYQQAHCLVFTLEMTGLQLVQRALMTDAQISQQHVRDGMLSDGMSDGQYREKMDDWKKIHNSARNLASSRIHIDPSAPLSADDIEARTRRFVRTKRAEADAKLRVKLTAENHPDIEGEIAAAQAARLTSDRPDIVIFLDYLQLLLPSDPKLPRYLQIKADCQKLAFLCKELNIACAVLFQLKDQENEGADKLPQMSDARESGDIENFMHEMVFVHRRYLYVLDPAKAEAWCNKHMSEEGGFEWRVGTPKASGIGQRDLVHRMDLVVAKNREGPQGVVMCHFEPSFTKFDNWNPREKLFSNNPHEQQHYTPGHEEEGDA